MALKDQQIASKSIDTMVVTHATWIDCHLRSLRSRSAANDVFDGLAESHLNDDEKYLNSILEHHGSNFMLVPSVKKGHLHCIHHC